VTVLPTIIVMDSKGRQVARYEESMSASKMSEVLDKHNLPQHRSRLVTMANSYNEGFGTQTSKTTTIDSPTRSLFLPSAPPTPASPINSYNNVPPRKVIAPDPVTKTSSDVGEKRAIPTSGFTIQTGAYGQLSNAQQVVADMKPKAGNQKQYIMQSKANGKMTYRILIGSFTSRQEADAFRRKAAIEGYVRSFGEFAKKG
jgi:septal ring-binding cell division protein DamX